MLRHLENQIFKVQMCGSPSGRPDIRNIKRIRICGESGDVHGETVQSLKERLPEIVRGYDKENIWNMD